MKKISKLKLKNWFTLDEAAKNLSADFEEEITIGDILQFCYEGYITLSIRFSEPEKATPYNFVCNKDDLEQHRSELIDVDRFVRHMAFIVDTYKSRHSTEKNEILKIISAYSNDEIAERIYDYVNLDRKLKFMESIQIDSDDLVNYLINNLPFNRINLETIAELPNGDIYKSDFSNCSKVKGIYDLAMIGNERLDIEFLFCQNQDMKTPNLICIDGFFVIDTRVC